MVLGSSGLCIENCGDGKNFGLNECDDGNTVDGDGCSSTCDIEEGWICSGGTSSTNDICTHIEVTISSINITEQNNIILKFSEPVFITGTLTTDDIEV
jgi:cysteine-rich repeat protein